MTQLYITCFHVFHATVDQQPVAFRSNKGRALLLYLAVEQQRAHTRSALAGLLWPDLPENHARRNLSQTLLEVRKAIGDSEAPSPFLQITPQSLAIEPATVGVDVVSFLQATDKQDYAQAVALYQGDFLADFTVDESDLWDAWAAHKREQFRQLALHAFLQLGSQYETQGQWNAALTITRRLLTLAPWQEAAHCALMRLLARTGQRSAALAQYDTLTTLLLDEFGVPPSPETDALYDQIVAGEIQREAQAAGNSNQPPLQSSPFQAPMLQAYFVGRSDERQQLLNAINRSDASRFAIVGMGGIGKTALATELAHQLRQAFADGILWANPLTSSPLDILASWAGAYGYDFHQLTDLGSRSAAVRGLLAERHALIIIDNVERVSTIEPLLPNNDTCTIIITTRDLDVATALNAQPILLHEFDIEEALLLLRHIVGDERITAEATAATALCTLCGALPLAVKIAAERLKSRRRMKLAQMVTRLSDQQQRLDLQISDRAVRTSFAVSWEALTSVQQILFAQLALFAGRSFALETVTHMAAVDPLVVEEMLYTLEALSLVRTEDNERYSQHPLLADFAMEKLTDTAVMDENERTATYIRFVEWYAHFAQHHAIDYAQLEPEWENLMAAMQFARKEQQWTTVIAFAEHLQPAWFQRARYTEARSGLQWAYAAAQATDNKTAAAKLLLAWGEACLEQNDYTEAITHLEQARQHYQSADEQLRIADVQDHLARIAIEQNQYEEAGALLAQNLQLRTAAADWVGRAAAIFQQARIAYANTEWAAAKLLAEDALTVQQAANDGLGTIRTARLLAQIMLQLKEYGSASDYCQLALTLCEALQNENEMAITLYTLTGIHRLQGTYDAAKTTAERSQALLRRMGDLRTEGLLLYQVSDIDRKQGEWARAIEHGRQSVAIFRQLNDKVVLIYTLLQLGDLYQAQAAPDQSHACWQEAATLADVLAHTALQAACAERLGHEHGTESSTKAK